MYTGKRKPSSIYTYHAQLMPTTNWSIGVCLGISSSIVSNVGVNIQKLAHSRRAYATNVRHSGRANINFSSFDSINDGSFVISPSICTSDLSGVSTPDVPSCNTSLIEADTKQPSKTPYLMDPCWIVGLILQIMGAFMDFVALGFAPASVVAPLGSLTLVTNVCLAPIMHHERLHYKVLLATSLIILGTITTVIFSPRSTDVATTEQLFGVFASTAFVAYAVPCSLILLTTFGIKTYMNYLKENIRDDYTTRHYKIHRFSIATLSGTMGAQNIFFAKCVSTLMVFSLEGHGKSMWKYWQTYLVLCALFGTIWYQLKWLNDGLMEFSALYIVPTFQSWWITISVIGGLTVYEEFANMKLVDKLIFPVGIIITICGVVYLTSQSKPKQLHEPTEMPMQNETSVTHSVTLKNGVINLNNDFK
eukprot:458059_1